MKSKVIGKKEQDKIDALKFVSRFSLPPNSLGYCGRKSGPVALKNCIIKGRCGKVEEELSRFIVLNPYLKTLSAITKLPPFDYKVVESYWLGNNQLNKAKAKHYSLLLENFIKQGVPKALVEELKLTPPKEFIPTHLFQILHVGIGRVKNSITYNLASINQCMIRWGRVQKIETDKIVIKLNSLKETKKGYRITLLTEILTCGTELVPELKKGDVVAVHWGQIIKILTKEEVEKITFWTKKVLK
ncbi:MAG: hypothetical protein ACD_22C00142G0005 [uncultured bacterium]|nr:MAG: hypothetical protein ACD_22C00142G0005 [uncultured bacterium]